nr:MAG TPA: hypothetical protein [Caudoviricetes sp.]
MSIVQRHNRAIRIKSNVCLTGFKWIFDSVSQSYLPNNH